MRQVPGVFCLNVCVNLAEKKSLTDTFFSRVPGDPRPIQVDEWIHQILASKNDGFVHGNLRGPPQWHPPHNKALFLGGGGIGGVPLDSHDL